MLIYARPMTALEMPSGSFNGLPADVTSFVGRRRERTQIKHLLSEARLVTLTGVGGVGKTRLGLRAAAESRNAFRDGVVVVDLAPVTDPALLAYAVAKALGLYTLMSGSVRDLVVTFLMTREVLLVIDNCEHQIGPCAELVDTLLSGCPGVRVLATSREPLNIPGEVVLPVPPLSFPAVGAGVGGRLMRYQAVTLFVDRAQATIPGFRITDDNREDVVAICRQLDGIPLALELAAVRLRGLTPSQLLDRLADRFLLLNAGSRTAPDRQRTLRGCIEWSFDLCTAAERALWARVSVFSGGFELEVAEAVCTPVNGNGGNVLDTLLSLVEKSILISETADGQMRYRMLEVIRQYGEQHLRSLGEERAMRARHRDFFAGLAARPEREWVGAGHPVWIARMGREHPNVQAALAFCLTESGGAEIGLCIAAGLRDYWVNTGTLGEGKHWIELLLRHEPATPPTRAWALRSAAWASLLLGDVEYARNCIEEARHLGTDSDTDAVAMSHCLSALLWTVDGDFARAIEYGTKALEAARATANSATEISSLDALQTAYCYAGDFERSLEYQAQSLRLAESIGDVWHLSYSLGTAGIVQWMSGKGQVAAETLRRSLQLHHELGNELGVAIALELLAWVTASLEPQKGATLLSAAESCWDAIGVPVTAVPLMGDQHARSVEELQRKLGPERFAKVMKQGARLDLNMAVAVALGRFGGKSASTAGTVDGGTAPLTRREREVAELVARGLTNREISQALVISQRTAETHVERILIKLGLSSRVLVAAWISDHH